MGRTSLVEARLKGQGVRLRLAWATAIEPVMSSRPRSPLRPCGGRLFPSELMC